MWCDIIQGQSKTLQWSDMQERIDWLLDQNINFQRDWIETGRHTDRHCVIRFMFDNRNDAMMFKLRWGSL